MLKKISWITFNAFIDTDLYAVRELAKFYQIDWHIIRSENDKFEYMDEVEMMTSIKGLTIKLHVCGKRLRMPSCISYYDRLLISINRTNPDLVYASMAGAPYFIPVFSYHTNFDKTVLAIHNVHVPKGGSAYYFFKLYNKFSIFTFKYFHVFSKSQYQLLNKLAHSKKIIYTPFLLKNFGISNTRRTSERITFLNFGNIRDYKRIDVLIDAAQQVYENTHREFRVIIAGKCDNWIKYKKTIKYANLFDIRLGHIENGTIPDLFNECDYFVAPYQDIAQSGSSIVAINYEKPIIASKLPAFEEYIVDGKTGYLIKPADVESLAKIMTKILFTHEVKYSNMVKSIKKIKEEHFSKDVIIRKYRDFFDEIIEK